MAKEVDCAYCGTTLMRPPVRFKSKNQYCDWECYRRSMISPAVIIQCETCGEDFTVKECDLDSSRRTGPRRFCSKSCAAKSPRPQRTTHITLVCQHCQETFEVIPSLADIALFCSRKCYLDSRTRYEVCKWCGVKFHINRRAGTTSKYCSRECYDASKTWVTLICETCGNEFTVHPFYKDRKYCSYPCVRWDRVSGTERTVAAELDRRNIPYTAQLKIGPYFPDFVISETVLLEVDGDYWHTRPDIVEHDTRKNAWYAENDYHVIRIWEHEVNVGDFSKLDVLAV